MFSTVLFGRLSDRLGRPRLVIGGAACLIPLFALMPASETPFQFGCLLAAWSFLIGAYWPPLQAWIGDLRPPGAVGAALGWFNIGWSTGVMVGSLVGGLLFEVAPAWPFRFSLTCCAAIVALVLLAPRPQGHAKDAGASAPTAGEPPPNNGRFLYLGWLANAVGFFLSGTLYSLFPKLAERLVTDWPFWAWIAVTYAASRTFGFVLVIPLQQWLYRPRALLATYAVLNAAMVMVVFANSPWVFFVAMALVGLCNAFSYSWSMLHSIEKQPRKGRTASYHESLLRCGDFAGAFLAGASAQVWGLRAPYVVCVAVSSLGAAVQQWMRRGRGGSRDDAAAS